VDHHFTVTFFYRKNDAVADYLIQKGSDVKVANNNGQTASHRAAAYGHAHILRKLMAKGADFNAVVSTME
jgi:ankyrin repeat protein